MGSFPLMEYLAPVMPCCYWLRSDILAEKWLPSKLFPFTNIISLPVKLILFPQKSSLNSVTHHRDLSFEKTYNGPSCLILNCSNTKLISLKCACNLRHTETYFFIQSFENVLFFFWFSFRLRSILKQLEEKDVDFEEIKNNLDFTASLLESVYLDGTR